MSDHTISMRMKIEPDENNSTVYAMLTPGNEAFSYTDEWLETQLSLQGYAGLSVSEKTRKELAEFIAGNKPGKLPLGKKVDAKVEVIISPDSVSASLRITAAQGGVAIGTKEVLAALLAQNIDLDLVIKQSVVELIRKSLRSEPGTTLEAVIAKGQAPKHGKDTQFKCLLDGLSDRKPRERADGSIDYCDLGELMCVAEGTPLMRKFAPTEAKNGRSVTGEELSARIGKDENFQTYKGSQVSATDPDLLVAAIKGQPSRGKNGMRVDSLYTVKNVDVHSGHIDYDGSVIVRGDVASGMKIKASGDVQIYGIVENASIAAGGNIDIKLGAMGRADTPEAANSMAIKCQGNLSVAYLENAIVQVSGDVLVKSRISNCQIKAGHQVSVGNQQEKSGIVGGYVSAGSIIRTKTLGSSAGTLTEVAIVCSEEALQRFENLKQEIVERNEIIVRKLGQMIALSKKQTEEAKQSLAALKQESENLKGHVNELIAQKDELEAYFEQVQSGEIIVQKEAFPNVTLRIGDQELAIKSRYSQGTFSLIKGVLSHSSSL